MSHRERICRRWGTPDYFDDGNYVDISDQIKSNCQNLISGNLYTYKQLEKWAWRWEFLRRTPCYRGYWKKYKSFENEYGIVFHSEFQFAGLLPDPREPFHSDIRADDLRHIHWEDGVKNYSIDHRRPLGTQLEEIEDIAKRDQEAFFRTRASLGLTVPPIARIRKRTPNSQNRMAYLRALDAKEQGATYAEIATVLNLDSTGSTDAGSHGKKFVDAATEWQLYFSEISDLSTYSSTPTLIDAN